MPRARSLPEPSVDPRLTAVVRRHLRALGFVSADDYLGWCKREGFPARLNKTVAQRQTEMKAGKQIAARQKLFDSFTEHLAKLNLSSESEYVEWCSRHGFGTGLHKSHSKRLEEIRRAQKPASEKRPALDIKNRHRRRDAIEQVAEEGVEPHELISPVLQRLAGLFDQVKDQPQVHESFLHLLRGVEKSTPMFHVKPAWSGFGQAEGNTFIDGLFAISQWQELWIEEPSSWKPESRNQLRQFGDLARHLLARYPVPRCMDSCWFAGTTNSAMDQQDWFIHVGSGQNIRKAGIPLNFSKRMAHEFLTAPPDLSVTEALRWSQYIGLGGDEHLSSAIVDSRLGSHFHDEKFWESVLYFFVNNPMLDNATIGPIVDYIYNQRYVPVEVEEDMDNETAEPPQPDFTMKGRSVESILCRLEVWHRDLAREARKIPQRWSSGGFNGLEHVEEDANAGEIRTWTIEELLSSDVLYEEGKEMRNCIASYKSSCARNQKSIWSMKVSYEAAQATRRVLTISVDNHRRKITQVRGRNNSLPNQSDNERYRIGWELLQQWAKQESLAMPSARAREMQPV